MARHDKSKWEEAFIKFGFDAAVGRLFRGIIHNLNGVGQAFSMQAELLPVIFAKADAALENISQARSVDEARHEIARLREMLASRAELVKHLAGGVRTLQGTMQRASILAQEVDEPSGVNYYSLAEIVETEMEFLSSDGFFKHKVRKELEQADEITGLVGHWPEVHQIVGILLENASQALAANIGNEPAPAIMLSTSTDGVSAELRVTDNGPGFDAADSEKIFEPFFTTRENHLGMGLYLARVMATAAGGTLTCASSPGRTSFILKIPLGRGQA